MFANVIIRVTRNQNRKDESDGVDHTDGVVEEQYNIQSLSLD